MLVMFITLCFSLTVLLLVFFYIIFKGRIRRYFRGSKNRVIRSPTPSPSTSDDESTTHKGGRMPTYQGTAVTQTTSYEEQLRKRGLSPSPPSTNYVSRSRSPKSKSADFVVVETAFEDQESEVDVEAERKRRRANEQQSDEARKIQRDQNKQKSDMEFQQKKEEKTRDHQENFKKTQEEIQDYENETLRKLEEDQQKLKHCEQVFMECMRLKIHFDEKKKEWADWLKTLEESIKRVIKRFDLFEKLILCLDENGSEYPSMLMNELQKLHKVTLSAHQLLNQSWSTANQLCDQFPDRIFLRILRRILAAECDKFTSFLVQLDYSMENGRGLNEVAQLFRQLNVADIPKTWQLSEMSKTARPEDYLISDTPREYGI